MIIKRSWISNSNIPKFYFDDFLIINFSERNFKPSIASLRVFLAIIERNNV